MNNEPNQSSQFTKEKRIVLNKKFDTIRMGYQKTWMSSVRALIKPVLSCPWVDNTSVHTRKNDVSLKIIICCFFNNNDFCIHHVLVECEHYIQYVYKSFNLEIRVTMRESEAADPSHGKLVMQDTDSYVLCYKHWKWWKA